MLDLFQLIYVHTYMCFACLSDHFCSIHLEIIYMNPEGSNPRGTRHRHNLDSSTATCKPSRIIRIYMYIMVLIKPGSMCWNIGRRANMAYGADFLVSPITYDSSNRDNHLGSGYMYFDTRFLPSFF